MTYIAASIAAEFRSLGKRWADLTACAFIKNSPGANLIHSVI